jgi:hypothetical protein
MPLRRTFSEPEQKGKTYKWFRPLHTHTKGWACSNTVLEFQLLRRQRLGGLWFEAITGKMIVRLLLNKKTGCYSTCLSSKLLGSCKLGGLRSRLVWKKKTKTNNKNPGDPNWKLTVN